MKNKKKFYLSILAALILFIFSYLGAFKVINNNAKSKEKVIAVQKNLKGNKENNHKGNKKHNKEKGKSLNAGMKTSEITDEEIQGEKNVKDENKVQLEEYKGKVEHIFFHPLIIYPRLAFDKDYQSKSMDDWFVTKGEFKKIVSSLYKKNFILVDINSIYEEKTINGNKYMKRKHMMIPKGKKPIIISIDDLNYYDYMIKNGTSHKLILDKEGNVANYSVDAKGTEVVSHDDEIVTILDKFVEEHPDFSFKGAKGTIGVTGYEGILGYRTNFDSPNRKEESEKALKVVKRLKETGWNFASHSYGHPNFAEITYEKAKRDIDKWKKEVEPLIGNTKVFIYPYGDSVNSKDPKFKYLLSKGFNIMCAVGSSSYEEIIKEAALTDRRHIDGISLRNQRDKFLDLYDSKDILDLEWRNGTYSRGR